MGFFGKLAFWKKKDDLDDLGKDLGLDKDFGMDKGMGMEPPPPMNSMNSGPSPDLGMNLESGIQPMQKYPSFQQNSSFQVPSYQPPQPFQQSSNDNYIAVKNLEVISSKLDALKAAIDSLNARIANIEAIARVEQENQRRRIY